MIISKKKDAFTLVEIMIAVVIIGILAAMLLPTIGRRLQRFYDNQASYQIQTLKTALQEYRLAVGKYPTRQDRGLNALVTRPPKASPAYLKWRGPYGGLKQDELPVDPWNNEFIYNSPPVRYKKEAGYKFFEIYSLGSSTEDDDQNIFDGE